MLLLVDCGEEQVDACLDADEAMLMVEWAFDGDHHYVLVDMLGYARRLEASGPVGPSHDSRDLEAGFAGKALDVIGKYQDVFGLDRRVDEVGLELLWRRLRQ